MTKFEQPPVPPILAHKDYAKPSAFTPESLLREARRQKNLADVAVPVAVRGTFTYSIPPHLRDDVRLGSRVEVPLGTKRTTGFVVNLIDTVASTAKLKPIHSVLDEDEPALLPEIIDLCRWAAEYYIAPLGEMLRVALPANMASRGRRELSLGRPPAPARDGMAPVLLEGSDAHCRVAAPHSPALGARQAAVPGRAAVE